jgi:translation initiation factor IF-2
MKHEIDSKCEAPRERARLGLPVATTRVRQALSRGRTRLVQVEVRRRAGARSGSESAVRQQPLSGGPAIHPVTTRQAPVLDDKLTRAECEARQRAVEQAREDEARRAQEQAEAALRAAREVREGTEDSRRRHAIQATQDAADDGRHKRVAPVSPGEDDEAGAQSDRSAKRPGKVNARDRGGKLTVSRVLQHVDGQERVRSLAALRRQQEREKQSAHQAPMPRAKVIREVLVPEAITVRDLANRMAEGSGNVVKALIKLGLTATINQTIDADTAELVISEFGHKTLRASREDAEAALLGEPDHAVDVRPRPPVVTVMGHVDHGKTSLLDTLRKTDVAAREAGGITQHIGAYQIEAKAGRRVTFIDTPGHAAFTQLRARGAKVTDVVVLVVAADDGVMAQTVEAISHARAANVPMVAAINKIDQPGADPNRVKRELLQHGLVPEDMGGDVICVPVSAKTREGLDELIEAILLQADLLDLRANHDRPAEGVIIESRLEQGRGAVATALVQRGTLKIGDMFVAGSEYGRVRALFNDRGHRVTSGGPSEPLEVTGLKDTCEAGDNLVVVADEQLARKIAAQRAEKKRQAQSVGAKGGTLERMMARIKHGEGELVRVVIKSDVQGSREAVAAALEKLAHEEVKVAIVHAGVGAVSESDVMLARASDAAIIAFNVRASPQASELASRDGVEIRYYSVIYNVIDDVKAIMAGRLAPETIEKALGRAEVREVFSIPKVGKVAGCLVAEGMFRRGAKVRLTRDDAVIHDGTLKSLRRFKDEAREVQQGYECGMALEGYQDFRIGDRIECYEVQEIARTL